MESSSEFQSGADDGDSPPKGHISRTQLKNNFMATMLIFLGALVVVGCLHTTKGIPGNALIYADDSIKEYFSPWCIATYPKVPIKYRKTTYSECSRLAGYHSNVECRDNGDFYCDGGMVAANFLRKFGLLPPIPNRWNPDGSWNW